MLHPAIFGDLRMRWLRSGRSEFDVDAACDIQGYNYMVKNGKFCSKNNSFLNANHLVGCSIYANPDWRLIPHYINKFAELQCQNRATQMALVTSFKPHAKWFKRCCELFDLKFKVERQWRAPAHCQLRQLFSRPVVNNPALREDAPGNHPTDVCIWFSKKPHRQLAKLCYVEPDLREVKLDIKDSIGDLLTFPCQVKGESGCLLFDTGAQMNVVSANLVDALRLQGQHCDIDLGWLNGEQVKVNKVIPHLVFNVGKHQFSIRNALVAPLVNYDIVVGVKSHQELGCKIDFELRKLTLRNQVGQFVTLIPSRHVIPKSSAFSNALDVGICSFDQFRQMATDDDVELFFVQFGEQGDVHVNSAAVVLDENQSFDSMVDAVIGADCPAHVRPKVKQLLQKYKKVFDDPKGLPAATPFDLKLKLKPNATPYIAAPYKLGMEEGKELSRRIRQMLDWSWIERYSGEWGPPLIVLRKPQGGWRIVCDYRKVD